MIVLRAVSVCAASGLGDERVLDGETLFCACPLAQFAQRRVAPAAQFDPAAVVAQRKSLKLMNRAAQLAVAAARALPVPARDRERAGLFLGVGMSGGEIAQLAGLLDESLDGGEVDLAKMGANGLARLNPLLSFHVLNNMPLCHVSIELGLGGPHGAIYAAGAEALDAFAAAADALAAGEAPWAIAGGADAPLDTVTLALRGGDERLAEAAALALLLAVDEPAPGDLEWAEPGGADREITVEETAARFGDSLAASGALAVAEAVRILRMHADVRSIAIRSAALPSVSARLRRVG